MDKKSYKKWFLGLVCGDLYKPLAYHNTHAPSSIPSPIEKLLTPFFSNPK